MNAKKHNGRDAGPRADLSSRAPGVPARPTDMIASSRSTSLALASLTVLAALASGSGADSLFCDGAGCDLSDLEWTRLQSLAGPLPAPTDPSNRFLGNAKAETLGQAFYYDPRFS